jgi:hypothetical protein
MTGMVYLLPPSYRLNEYPISDPVNIVMPIHLGVPDNAVAFLESRFVPDPASSLSIVGAVL